MSEWMGRMLLTTSLVLVGCGGGGSEDGGSPTEDAGGRDAGAEERDAGPADAGAGEDGGGGDAGRVQEGPSRATVTGGSGTAQSSSYRLRVSVGAPQPMGAASSSGRILYMGPRQGR